jgi:arsenate reductase
MPSPLTLSLVLAMTTAPANTEALRPELKAYTIARLGELERIPAERKKDLTRLASWVRAQVDKGETPKLVFICTHNSRRSHIAQLWAQTAADVFGVPKVETYSGGTEATAFNPRAAAAMRRAGFEIEETTEGDNPVYVARYGPDGPEMKAFSKVYDAEPNPKAGFAAVMTCGHADASCPTVRGAVFRVATPYDDPKAFDGTPKESAAYDERVAQISRELLYVFSQVKP